MKTLVVRFRNCPAIAFSIQASEKKRLYKFITSLGLNVERVVKDAVIHAFKIQEESLHMAEEKAGKLLSNEREKTEFMYNSVIDYLPTICERFKKNDQLIRKFLRSLP